MTMIPVRVAVRCRPPIGAGEELEGIYENLQCDCQSNKISFDDKRFTFDAVFDSSSSQQDVYDNAVAALVNKFISGSNGAVIAYGQTGSGKTHTMGTDEEFDMVDGLDEENCGIIPRMLRQVFSSVTNLANKDKDTTIKVSFFEVYNEEVYDLLNVKRPRIAVREESHEVKLCGLTEMEVSSFGGAMACLERGARIRTTAPTAMNTHSSRSHAIFSVLLERHKSSVEFACSSSSSSMMMVDLAGSEVAKKTKTSGTRFKEGVNINRGLFTLGNVINTLSREKGRGHVPYRDSTLTRLLQKCLQSNCHSLLISCISPMEGSILETTGTLCFSSHARAIKAARLSSARFTGPLSALQTKTPCTGGITRTRTYYDTNGRKVPRLGTAYTPSTVVRNSSMAKDTHVGDDAPSSNIKVTKPPITLPSLDESPDSEIYLDVQSSVIDEMTEENDLTDVEVDVTIISKGPEPAIQRFDPNSFARNQPKFNSNAAAKESAHSPEINFKIPVTLPIRRTNSMHVEPTSHSFSPMVRRICESIETTMCHVADRMNRSAYIDPLSTPVHESLVDAVVRRITSSRHSSIKTPFQSTDSRDATYEAEPNLAESYLGIPSTQRVMPPRRSARLSSSVLNRPHGKENAPVARRRKRHECTIISPLTPNMSKSFASKPRDSAAKYLGIMSPSNLGSHKRNILHVLNNGTVRELKHLPVVGPKSALILYNWRVRNGSMTSIEDMRKIPGLATGFSNRFIMANMCGDE